MTAVKRAVALYARVSTSDQRSEVQLHTLREYASRRWGLAAADVMEFVDHGISGTCDRRPALDELMTAVRRQSVDAVVCTKLDRLARSVRHLTTLAEEFDALGVDLVILDQAIDTSTPAGKLMFHVLGAIAEFERALIVDRTRAGLVAARRRGKRLGRPYALDAEQVKRARRMRGAGQSVSHCARVLGVSRATIRKALQQRA